MHVTEYQKAINKFLSDKSKPDIYANVDRFYAVCFHANDDVTNDPENTEEDRKLVWEWSAMAKKWCLQIIAANGNQADKVFEIYNNLLLLEAPYLFDSYLLHLEKDRESKERFYLPKRKQFQRLGLIRLLQDLEDDKLDIGAISMPPGTGKTTLIKFFCSWVFGRHIADANLFYSHSGDITRMFYDGVLDICTNAEEYNFHTIFPKCKLQSTNAKRETINFGKFKPFQNLQTTSVGANNAGKVRVSEHGFLLCDDMIGGIEEAMSATRLDKLWEIFTTDARQRKKDGAKELHIATRWSVNDVIGRLQRAYEGDERARFIAVPDIDPVTGKSNFDFQYNGFSVAFYEDIAKLMDDVSYRCLYKNEPIEREGLLYHPDDFERFYELPSEEPDAILGICDTKDKGSDFCCLPVFYQYGDRYFLADVLYDNNSNVEIIDQEIVDIITKHNPHQVQFESNSAGGRVADDTKKSLKDKKVRTNITKKYTTANKETKIIVNSAWVKSHVLLKDASMYSPKSQYANFVRDVCAYTVAGRNAHDDSVDALAMFAEFTQKQIRPTVVISNPFGA